MSHSIIHRGLAKKNFKENTLKSFKYCFNKKYGIETDLHCTKDDIIICFHDFSLKRKFKTNKLVKNLTFDEINKISNKFGYYIPKLEELIKISNNKRYLMLEIKSDYLSKLRRLEAEKDLMKTLKEEFNKKIHALEIRSK